MLKKVPLIPSLTATVTLSIAASAIAQEKEVVLHPYEGAAWETGEPLEDDGYRWFSNRGELVAEGPRIDIQDTYGLTTYLRAELRSDGGLTYTQPFGLADR